MSLTLRVVALALVSTTLRHPRPHPRPTTSRQRWRQIVTVIPTHLDAHPPHLGTTQQNVMTMATHSYPRPHSRPHHLTTTTATHHHPQQRPQSPRLSFSPPYNNIVDALTLTLILLIQSPPPCDNDGESATRSFLPSSLPARNNVMTAI
ncbi:hypothetical protein EV363DRAFT_1454472 [Boletus edulis]|nr:hypothetical protein EV363DRAFT_1454472 [Boletus edulis]